MWGAAVEECFREGEVAGLNPRSREARDFRAKNEGGRVADQWWPPRVKKIAIFSLFLGSEIVNSGKWLEKVALVVSINLELPLQMRFVEAAYQTSLNIDHL